jgi:hypothetical protein
MKDLNYLRAELSVLLVNDFTFDTGVITLQKELLRRFKTNYSLDEIEDEFLFLKLENDVMMQNEAVVLESEQFFEGWN